MKKNEFNLIIAWIIFIFIILILKLHFSLAPPNSLKWILSPVVFLVSIFTGELFQFIHSIGYENYKQTIIIETSCAGINFLIILYSLLIYEYGFLKLTPLKSIIALLISYILTILVNSFRIITAITILPITGTGSTEHLILSVSIYLTFIVIFYQLFIKAKRKFYEN